jgi:hypothetical protein
LFVTSQGSDLAGSVAPLDSGNLTVALVEARQLQHVGLGEALELVLLIRDQQPEKFTPAALRWHSRYCREVRTGLDEAQAVLAALGALRSPRREAAAYALADLICRRGLEWAGETLIQWSQKS